MVYKPLLRIFEERRAKLLDTLKGFDRGSQLERQHQIYGAIQELEVVMKTIQANASKMQQEAEQMSAERLVNETIVAERRKLDTAFKDIKSHQYDIDADANSPFKPQ